MSHILSSDRRPVSLSMPSLNVNSLLNLLVNRSCQGFPFQMGASYRRLQGVDDASLLAVVRAFSEYGSRVFGLSRHALILNHVCIHVTSRALRRMRSARVRSAPESQRSDTACFKPSPLAPMRPRAPVAVPET